MTPRKEIYIKLKEALATIPEIELIDLERDQFKQPKDNYPTQFTAVLIDIKAIRWESMVENKQEGNSTIDVTLYTKDGWLDQHDGTADDEHGLVEIDLQDTIVEKIQFLKGDYFKPIELTNEESIMLGEVMSYKLTFSTLVYRRINPLYTNRKVTIQTP
ncbi:hypothetical protein FIA58_013875 [Flavobacterium jejuense]|uniref:Uncharacterized protein n=1 Tax=Flavobacterium jejuense TaxID=1544455 RepID=A0ABX0IYE6_9FLAO|nr:hypothetical protein [Flavobacterium jejuense]NHN26769.1 hypothetical protein [Flavobacterium jejuense]